jgi:hypothetical protein
MGEPDWFDFQAPKDLGAGLWARPARLWTDRCHEPVAAHVDVAQRQYGEGARDVSSRGRDRGL